jgi:hypothetical protein
MNIFKFLVVSMICYCIRCSAESGIGLFAKTKLVPMTGTANSCGVFGYKQEVTLRQVSLMDNHRKRFSFVSENVVKQVSTTKGDTKLVHRNAHYYLGGPLSLLNASCKTHANVKLNSPLTSCPSLFLLSTVPKNSELTLEYDDKAIERGPVFLCRHPSCNVLVIGPVNSSSSDDSS